MISDLLTAVLLGPAVCMDCCGKVKGWRTSSNEFTVVDRWQSSGPYTLPNNAPVIWGYCFRSHYGPEVDSASYRNEYPGVFPGGKGGRCVRLTTFHHPVPLSRNLGTLTSWNPLGLSEPVTALLFIRGYVVGSTLPIILKMFPVSLHPTTMNAFEGTRNWYTLGPVGTQKPQHHGRAYLLNYLRTYLYTYLLHGAESFLRS